jgi:hypothetical protein
MRLPDFSHPGNSLRITGIGAVIVVISIYYVVMQVFTIDIPFCDEYHVALQWLDIYQQTDGVWKKFLHLFSQANEHRIFTFSLAVLSDYTIFGVINFKRLLWEGNLAMLLLLFLVNLLNSTDCRNPWMILPVALLLFAPQNEITNWPLVSFGTILQSSMVIASLYLLSRTGWLNLAAAVLLAAIATFSFGNGMFTFVVGFLVLALKKPSHPVTWLVWSAAMTMAVFLYFRDYTFISESGRFESVLRNPIPVIQFFLTFFGSILRIPHVQTIWITLGGLIPILAFGYLIIFKRKEIIKYPVILAVLLFILISAALTAVSRQAFGVFGATAPRYILLQALFLALLFLLYMNIFGFRKRGLFPLLLAAGLLLYGVRLPYGIYSLNRHKNHLKEIISAYNTDPQSIITAGPPPNEIRRILDRSILTGVYTPPPIDGKFEHPFPGKR